MQDSLLEQRSADYVLVGAGSDGIESEGRKHIPGRSLAVVFVAAVAVRSGAVELVHGLSYPVLGLPGLSRVIIQIYHVLHRLVAVSVVAHVHHLHLADLVDYAAVVALVEERGYREHRIQHRHEIVAAAHQVDEPLRVVEDTPGVVPAVAFGECVAPFQRRERRLEAAVGIAAAHQAALLVEHVAVVEGALGIQLHLLVRPSQSLCQLPDAPVVVCIFQRAGHALVDAHIVGHISQFVVILPSKAACRAHCGMHSVAAVEQTFEHQLGLGHPQTFHVGVGQHGG